MWGSCRLNAKVFTQIYDHLLQTVDIPLHVQHRLPRRGLRGEAAQVHDRVSDQLAGPVEGDEAPAVGAHEVRPEAAQSPLFLLRVPLGAHARGVDRGVLHHHQAAAALPSLDAGHQLVPYMYIVQSS